nr:1496_t:CDS:2 [Entrophospora candida]
MSKYKIIIEEQEENEATVKKNSDSSKPLEPERLSTIFSAGIPPIMTYCASSILMTVTNKYVLSGYDFNMNFLLLCVQSIVCVLLLKIFKLFNLISYKGIDLELSKTWSPVAFLLVAMIYTGSKSLQFLAIPIYTIFKNLTIIFIAYGEVLWFGGSVTRLMMTSFLLMVFSSIIAASSDSVNTVKLNTFSSIDFGYIWMALNCISSAAFILFMRKRIKSTNFKDYDTVYYNNTLSIPLLVFMSLMIEDWSYTNLEKNFPIEVRQTLIISILFSGISAFTISYASAWCIRVTSSTTYSMVGALNKLPMAASGMIFFGDPTTFGSVSAVLVGFFSGVLYSIAKKEQQRVVIVDTKISNDNTITKSHQNTNDPIIDEKYIDHTENSTAITIEDDKSNEIN